MANTSQTRRGSASHVLTGEMSPRQRDRGSCNQLIGREIQAQAPCGLSEVCRQVSDTVLNASTCEGPLSALTARPTAAAGSDSRGSTQETGDTSLRAPAPAHRSRSARRRTLRKENVSHKPSTAGRIMRSASSTINGPLTSTTTASSPFSNSHPYGRGAPARRLMHRWFGRSCGDLALGCDAKYSGEPTTARR